MEQLAILIAATCSLSAFFSVGEAALVGLNEYRVKAYEREKGRSGGALSKLVERRSALLSTTLFLNTIVNIGGSALIGSYASKVFFDGDYLLFIMALTFCMLIFSEVRPKLYASNNPEKVASKIAPIMIFLGWLCRPIMMIINLFLKGGEDTKSLSELEVQSVLCSATEHGVMNKVESRIARNVFNLRTKKASGLVLKGSMVTTLPVHVGFEEAMSLAAESQYKRMIAVNADGKPVGVFLQRDILRQSCIEESERVKSISELVHPLKVVAEDCCLATLATDLYRSPNHIAIVADASDCMVGVITLSNIQELLLT